MADNITLPGTASVVATDDIGGFHFQRVKPTWGADGTAGDVSGTNPFPISLNASIFRFSSANTSVVQLAAGATFAGVWETALDQPSASLLLVSDQPITLTISQAIDVAGVSSVQPIVYNIPANQGFSASVPLNGNYVKVSAQNTGTATTTTLSLNTAYGNLPSSDGQGRVPISNADCVPLLSSTITAIGVSGTIDTVGYGSIVVQLAGVWQGNCYFEASNNLADWDTVLALGGDLVSLTDIVTSAGIYTVRPSGRYLRLSVTNITGSMTLAALGRAAQGVSAIDLLGLAMDEQNNTPLSVRPRGSAGLPMAQDPITGNQVVQPTVRNYAGAINAVSGVAFSVPCADMVTMTMTQMQPTGGSGTIVVEGFALGVWNALYCQIISSSGGSGNVNSIGTATGTVPQYVVAQLIGSTFVRVRATSWSAQPILINAQLTSTLATASGGVVNAAIIGTANVSASGSAAEDAAAGTQPVINGGVVRTAIAPSTLVAGDAVRATFTASAAHIVELHAVPELTWAYAAAAAGIVNTVTAVTFRAAVAAQRGNITGIQIFCEPLGAATEIAIRDGAAGTVMWRGRYPITTQMQPVQIAFDPPLRQSAVNTLLEVVTLTASITGAVYFNAQGFMSN